MAETQSIQSRRRDGDEQEVIHRVDLGSTAEVVALLFGGLLLALFMAALLPWLLAEATTAAVEGLMRRVGFGGFDARTIWDWLLVLAVVAVIAAVLVAFVVIEVAVYNRFVQKTGRAMPMSRRRQLVRTRTPARAAPAQALPRASTKRGTPGRTSSRFAEMTLNELYAEAQRQQIPGRSSMSKAELRRALERAAARR